MKDMLAMLADVDIFLGIIRCARWDQACRLVNICIFLFLPFIQSYTHSWRKLPRYKTPTFALELSL